MTVSLYLRTILWPLFVEQIADALLTFEASSLIAPLMDAPEQTRQGVADQTRQGVADQIRFFQNLQNKPEFNIWTFAD